MTTPRAPNQPDFGPTTQFDTVPASDVLLAGARVGGFRIVELLGRGDSGVVYLALDSSLQRQVAIKEYFPSFAQRGDDMQVVPRRSGAQAALDAGRQAFLQRAKLFARFDHPALVRVQSTWEENGTAYLAMNFVPGANLASALKGLPRAPDEAWLRAMLTPVLDAVDLLHVAQCHHGGISAEAIVVRSVGVPVLLGSAPPATDEKPLAPPGAWTDLRALASLLHAAVTGQAALGAAVPRVHRPLTGLPYSPRFLAGIDRALSVDPRQRLRSVGEFRRCLGWVDAAPAAAPAAPARAAPAAAASYADRPQQPPAAQPGPQRLPMVPRPNGRSEPGFGDSRFQSRFDFEPLPAPPPPRRTGLWLVLLCAGALAAGAVWLQLGKTRGAPKALASVPVATMPAASQAMLPVTDTARPPEPVDTAEPEQPAASASVAVAPPAVPVEAAPPPLSVQANAAAESAALPIVAGATSPRAACGTRTNFALLYCMQTQCARPQFARHAQCAELKRSGDVR